MLLKSILLKSAISISIALSFPDAIVLQELSSAVLDFLTDYYEDEQAKKTGKVTYKLTVLYKKCFSETNFRENGINYKKIAYYQSQISDILNYSKINVSLLAKCNNDAVVLCDYMVSAYRDNCLNGVLEDEHEIRKICTLILPEMTEIIRSDSRFLLDGIMALYPRVSQNEKSINELKECVSLLMRGRTRKVQLFPTFITNPPFGLTKHFVGRETLVDEVFDALYNEYNVMLFGIGGIGKTEIAKKVVNQSIKKSCDKCGLEQIAWIDYDNKDIQTSIARCILATSQIEDTHEAWMKALKIIMDAGNRLLLVIDNIEIVDDEGLWKLTQLPCKILITSRARELSDFLMLDVNHLTENECITLFQKYYTKQPDQMRIIAEIVDLADYHTVTIELLAKIANLEECSLMQFLERLRRLGFKMSDEETTSIHEKLHKEDKIIQQLAKLFSIVHLTNEETSLILPISVIPSMAFSYTNAKDWFKQESHKNLEHLVNTGWLQEVSKDSTKCYMIHSVVAAAIRFQYQQELYEKCRDFMAVLTKEMQYPHDEHGASKKYLIQFCWSINDLLEDHMQNEMDADFLLYLSRIYCDVADFEQALQLLRRCVRIYRKNDDYIVKLISSYNQIGIVYNEQNKNKYALTQYAKAFKLADRYSIEGALWVTLLLDAALVFIKTDGKMSGGFADCYFREAYNIAVEIYGEKHSETRKIKTLWNHCIASYDPVTANQNFLDIINEEEQLYPEKHINLAETYSSYATFLYEIGEFPQALIYIDKAYGIKKDVLGEVHPETADLRNYRGLILEYLDKYDEAKEEFQSYLEAVRKLDGEESTTVATAYNNLAIFYFDTEEYRSALSQFEKAEHIYRKYQRLYKEDITEDLALILRNEGQCYSELADEEGENPINDTNNAIDKYKEAIHILSADEVRYKFDIAQVYGALASAYVRKGWNTDAELSFKRAIKDTVESKNAKHPGLAYLYNNYAMLLDDMGRKEEALEQLQKAEKILVINGATSDSENLRIVRGAIKGIQYTLNHTK